MSRLSIDVSSEQHKKIKALAAIEGKSIKSYVLDRLFQDKSKVTVDDDEAWEELKNFLKNRIRHGEAEEVSTKSLDQITEEILQRHNVV